MSLRKLAIWTGVIGLLATPALGQSVQDSNTYPGSVPDTPQSENLRGQNDYDATGATGTIVEPVPVPGEALEAPGYDTEGGANAEMPLGSGEDPSGPGPNDQ